MEVMTREVCWCADVMDRTMVKDIIDKYITEYCTETNEHVSGVTMYQIDEKHSFTYDLRETKVVFQTYFMPYYDIPASFEELRKQIEVGNIEEDSGPYKRHPRVRAVMSLISGIIGIILCSFQLISITSLIALGPHLRDELARGLIIPSICIIDGLITLYWGRIAPKCKIRTVGMVFGIISLAIGVGSIICLVIVSQIH